MSAVPAGPEVARGFSGRDVLLVGRFELGEAIRTRLLLVMIVLFVGAGAVGAWGYTEILGRVERSAASVTGAPAPRRTGATVRRLRDSRSYRDMLRVFTGSDAKADYYARVPPIVVFFGWASFVFTPWLVLFTSSDTIATEVASRSIRFAALRTGRLEFALGKLLGQLAVVVGVTGLMAAAFYVVAWAQLSGFELGATALGLLSHWPRVIVYLLPFVAWALCASMITSSANVARLVALGGGVLLAILGGLAGSERLRAGPVSEALLDVAGYLTPFGHSEGLSFPPGGTLGVDLAALLALSVVYFAAGFAVLRRRDL